VKTIVFASQKGGGGKTTLSGHIAVEAERTGYPGGVVMMDMDPQASLSGWYRERKSETPQMVARLPGGLCVTLNEIRASGIGLVVIDTPPAITDSIKEAVQEADLVVVPAKPSPHDLRAVGATADIVASTRRQMVFVINQATQRARITNEALIALSEHGAVAPIMVHHRVDFQTSMVDGRTAVEVNPDSKSAEEIRKLWEYLRNRLERTTA
jgi:chromosome partitioning protein